MIVSLVVVIIFSVAFMYVWNENHEAEQSDNKPAMKAWGIVAILLVILVVIILERI